MNKSTHAGAITGHYNSSLLHIDLPPWGVIPTTLTTVDSLLFIDRRTLLIPFFVVPFNGKIKGACEVDVGWEEAEEANKSHEGEVLLIWKGCLVITTSCGHKGGHVALKGEGTHAYRLAWAWSAVSRWWWWEWVEIQALLSSVVVVSSFLL